MTAVSLAREIPDPALILAETGSPGPWRWLALLLGTAALVTIAAAGADTDLVRSGRGGRPPTITRVVRNLRAGRETAP